MSRLERKIKRCQKKVDELESKLTAVENSMVRVKVLEDIGNYALGKMQELAYSSDDKREEKAAVYAEIANRVIAEIEGIKCKRNVT